MVSVWSIITDIEYIIVEDTNKKTCMNVDLDGYWINMKGLKNERKERENLHLFLHFWSCTYWATFISYKGWRNDDGVNLWRTILDWIEINWYLWTWI